MAPMQIGWGRVVGVVPVDALSKAKRWLTIRRALGKFWYWDFSFQLSTMWSAGLMIIVMCMSFGNEWVRNIDIACNARLGNTIISHDQTAGRQYESLNDFCWNHGTYLVRKGTTPEYRDLTFPGVMGYDKEVDQVIEQQYYKYVWMVEGLVMLAFIIPYCIWKAIGMDRLVNLLKAEVQLKDAGGVFSIHQRRGEYFVQTLNVHSLLGVKYIFCKFLTIVAPVAIWFYLRGSVGQDYTWYGYDVMNRWFNAPDSWPNPMDVVFPIMAKCDYSRFGRAGDKELKSAMCQLPMNTITRWPFLFLWWWCVFLLILNSLSFLHLIMHAFPCLRRSQIRRMILSKCQAKIRKALYEDAHPPDPDNGDDDSDSPSIISSDSSGDSDVEKGGERRSFLRKVKVNVRISFSDWLRLTIITQNLDDLQVRDFLATLLNIRGSPIRIVVYDAPLPFYTRIGRFFTNVLSTSGTPSGPVTNDYPTPHQIKPSNVDEEEKDNNEMYEELKADDKPNSMGFVELNPEDKSASAPLMGFLVPCNGEGSAKEGDVVDKSSIRQKPSVRFIFGNLQSSKAAKQVVPKVVNTKSRQAPSTRKPPRYLYIEPPTIRLISENFPKATSTTSTANKASSQAAPNTTNTASSAPTPSTGTTAIAGTSKPYNPHDNWTQAESDKAKKDPFADQAKAPKHDDW